MVTRIGGSPSPLRTSLGELSAVALDGGRAAWIEQNNNEGDDRLELWTAELAPNLSFESARVVTVLPLHRLATPTLGGGVVAIPLEDRGNSHAVVRLDSNDLRVLRPPPDLMIERLAWVTADEIAVQIGPGNMAEAPSKLRRIPLAPLPPQPQG